MLLLLLLHRCSVGHVLLVLVLMLMLHLLVLLSVELHLCVLVMMVLFSTKVLLLLLLWLLLLNDTPFVRGVCRKRLLNVQCASANHWSGQSLQNGRAGKEIHRSLQRHRLRRLLMVQDGLRLRLCLWLTLQLLL